METSKLKNMVVLKNLPSNLVEEAIIILKSNKTVKRLEKIQKNKNVNENIKNTKEKDYVLKEAEMLVSKYISEIENHKNKETTNKKVGKEHKKLKKYAILASVIILVQTIIILIK